MKDLIAQINQLAGTQRQITFDVMAKMCAELNPKVFVETGCYRGTPGDGMSTMIFGLLAKHFDGHVDSFDIYQGAVDKAKELVSGLPVDVHCKDSVDGIRAIATKIDVLYLDSYDYEENDPAPCQAHQLLEAAAAIPKMSGKSIILLDDCSLPGGGKAKLADILILAMGWKRWKPEAQLYQNFYTKM